MSEGFLLGPDLLARTRRTIETVEGGVVGSGFRAIPTVLEGETPASQKVFRIATFSGAWAINSLRTVEFKYQTNTPNTAVVENLFFPFPGSTSTSQVYDCAIAKDGTAWYLIDVPMQTATAVFVSATASQSVVSDVQISATLNSNDCGITVLRTQTTASVTIVTSTHTSTYLSFKVS